MERNLLIEGIVALLVVLLVIYLIRKNRKDQKKYEEEIKKSEIKPEKHDNKHI